MTVAKSSTLRKLQEDAVNKLMHFDNIEIELSGGLLHLRCFKGKKWRITHSWPYRPGDVVKLRNLQLHLPVKLG